MNQTADTMTWDTDDNLHDDVIYGDDTGVETLTCPSCGLQVYEDSEKCPYCGDWIIPLAAHSHRPAWVRWVGMILIGLFLLSIVGGLLRSFF